MNPLRLRTGVQERHAGIVQVGQAVEFRVESFGDRVFNGTIAHVSPALEQTMRTFTVEALVDNKDWLLKPGFFAKGRILTAQQTVLSVPDTAVSVLAGVASVYVLADNKVTQQTVTLGVRQGSQWEIVDGLKGDETLAVSRLNERATGTSVRMLKPGESEVVPAAAVGGAEGPRGGGDAKGGDCGQGGGGRRGGGGGRRGQGGAGPQGGRNQARRRQRQPPRVSR